MPRLASAAALCLSVTFCAAQLPAPAALGDQIAGLLADPAVARDHWGIYVTNLDGQPLYALNEGQLFQPASNAKLFTTAAALALLGPSHTFTTRMTGALDQTSGAIHGDLTLIGSGDPSFESFDLPYVAAAPRPRPARAIPAPHLPVFPTDRDIDDLVAQLSAKGIHQIDGDIVGDDTLFPSQPYPEGWSIDDIAWGYAAPVSALSVADNELRITISPAATPGQQAFIALEQTVPYYVIQNETRTVATRALSTGIHITRMPSSRTLRIFGSIALMCGLACSGFLHWQVAIALLIAFLLLAGESYLATYTLSSFELSQGLFGPTEIRILLILGNLALLRSPYATLFGQKFFLFDIGGAIAAAAMFIIAIRVTVRHTAQLYRAEPLP